MRVAHRPSPTPDRAADGTIRVASVPAGHVYIRHLAPVGRALRDVVRLKDPVPSGASPAEQSRWWPPVMLDPAWIERAHDSFDVFHVQFGFDAFAPADLRRAVETLREHGKPLVHTAHDLRNPHHRTRDLHDAQLDVLIPAADAVITLTPGAAAEIERRWSREAIVLPHPHVVDFETMGSLPVTRRAPAERGGEFRVGLHVKSLRSCMDPLAMLPALVRAVSSIPGGVLQIDGHTDVLDPGGARYDVELASALRAAPSCVDVRIHDFFSDAELVDYLASLDLSVLPYRFGTHSGWLEACRDVGTPVAAPTCGYYADQGPVHSFTMDEDRLDEDELVDAVLAAYRQTPPPAEIVARRRAQRDQIAAAHAELYADLVEARCASA
ncbi:glycosyltransferase [Aeromicrobium piscarium]|uniref:Glycosyltransferase n=1 Tax=Aeromicrobium piscarium TaxID=2590901 RepID=A0A554S7N9_9ACTN|nr:glycosyltransferase [Aeromicrobium piscarium]TSD62370.1 glycosyltransferase [Aeromicrobium piscarium]